MQAESEKKVTPTNLVKSEIRRFLLNSEPEVVCVSGEWGVGKTFAWNEILNLAIKQGEIALKRYAYVSLFGINSLDQLKEATLENTEFVVGDTPNEMKEISKSLGNKLIGILHGAKDIASEIPYIGDAIKNSNSILFSLIQNQLICIDDLERRGDDLTMKDVLGLVSFLKERRGCKIAILLNKHALGTSSDEFRTILEKVVDVELNFAPTPIDAVGIALQGTDSTSLLIANHIVDLGISNIRVIKKIERFIWQVAPQINTLDKRLLEQSIHTISLLAWCKYQPKLAPSLEWIKSERSSRYYEIVNKKEEIEDERRWKSVLEKYGFQFLDDFDQQLLSGIENGFFDESRLLEEAIKREREILQSGNESSFDLAWRDFHDSFDDNQNAIAEKLVLSLKENAKQVAPVNLNATSRLLRDMGYRIEADEIIDYYVSVREEEADFWDIGEVELHGQLPDPKLEDAFNKKLEQLKKAQHPIDVLHKFADSNGWDDDDIADLSKASTTDLFQIFKNARGKEQKRLVRAALRFDQIENPSELMRLITQNAKDALTKIGEESAINALRVQKYGIRIAKPNLN